MPATGQHLFVSLLLVAVAMPCVNTLAHRRRRRGRRRGGPVVVAEVAVRVWHRARACGMLLLPADRMAISVKFPLRVPTLCCMRVTLLHFTSGSACRSVQPLQQALEASLSVSDSESSGSVHKLAAGFGRSVQDVCGCALCEAVLDVAQQVRRQPGEEAQVRLLVALSHGTEDCCYVVYCCYWLRHAVLGPQNFDDGAAAPLQWSAMRPHAIIRAQSAPRSCRCTTCSADYQA
jgi:hypothetical protein